MELSAVFNDMSFPLATTSWLSTAVEAVLLHVAEVILDRSTSLDTPLLVATYVTPPAAAIPVALNPLLRSATLLLKAD